MTDKQQAVARANAEAALARQQLADTAAVLQARLHPRTLVREVRAMASEKAADGVDAAKEHVGLVAGGAALVGLWFGRHRIARLFRRGHETPRDTASYSADAAQSSEGAPPSEG